MKRGEENSGFWDIVTYSAIATAVGVVVTAMITSWLESSKTKKRERELATCEQVIQYLQQLNQSGRAASTTEAKQAAGCYTRTR